MSSHTQHVRPIGRYLIHAFGIAYVAWGAILLLQTAGVPYGTPVTIALLLVGGNAPLVAGFLAQRRLDPSFTVRRLLKVSFDVRSRPGHALLAIAVVAVYFGSVALVGGILPEAPPAFGGTEPTSPVPVLMAMMLIPFMALGGGLEELGWRHYLQPAMQERLPFVPATVVVSVIWVAWHAPLFAIVGTTQNASSPLVFAVTTLGLGFALGALHAVTGSAALCVLAHSAINAMSAAWPVTDDLARNLVMGAALIAFAVVVMGVATTRSRRLPPESEPTPTAAA